MITTTIRLITLLVCITLPIKLQAASQPMTVILDTDIASDIDDVGALTLLNYYESTGHCKILAVIVDQRLSASADACKEIDSYWGHGYIPVGQEYDPRALSDTSVYAAKIAAGMNALTGPTFNSTQLYRKTLAGQAHGNVTIICIGHEKAFDDLLRSASDSNSSLSGRDLVKAKVSRVVIMGGDYSLVPNLSFKTVSPEYNFCTDAVSTADMVTNLNLLRIPTYYIGFTLGNEIPIGGATTRLPFNSPLREAYSLYDGNRARSGWDVVAAHFAIVGTGENFNATRGSNAANPINGSNSFTVNPEGSQYYVTLVGPPKSETDTLNSIYDDCPPSK